MSLYSPKVIGFFCILLAAILWGSSFVFVQNTVTQHIWVMTTLRLIFASLSVLAIFSFQFKVNIQQRPTLKHWRLWFLLGFLMFLSLIPQAFGLRGTSVANSAVITSLYVIFTPFCVWFFLSRLPSVQKWVATFVGFSAFLVLGYEQGFTTLSFYDALTFFSALAIAIHIVFFEQAVRERAFFYHALLVPTLFCLLMTFVCSIFLGHWEAIASISTSQWGELFYLGSVATALPYVLMGIAQIHLSPVQIVLVTASEPFWAMLVALWVKGDPLTQGAIVACILLILANYIGESRIFFSSKNRFK